MVKTKSSLIDLQHISLKLLQSNFKIFQKSDRCGDVVSLLNEALDILADRNSEIVLEWVLFLSRVVQKNILIEDLIELLTLHRGNLLLERSVALS